MHLNSDVYDWTQIDNEDYWIMDPNPQQTGFYTEYRVKKDGKLWNWLLVFVTWDDEGQATETAVRTQFSFTDFLDAVKSAEKDAAENAR